MLDQAATRRVRVGAFELDVDSGELSNNGHRQILPEQPLALLKALIARRGGLVTRDELRKELWPEDTFVDFEHGLNAAVKRLRDALGDSAEKPRFIETVPRRGYRLVAPVEDPKLGQPTTALDPVQNVLRSIPSPWTRRVWWIAAATIVLSGVALRVWWISSVSPRTGIASSPMRVVPLTTLPGYLEAPTFSPDGTQVAFDWNGGGSNGLPVGTERHVYVTAVGSSDIRRITTAPGDAFGPKWSPNGRDIAFFRYRPEDRPEGNRIYLVSEVGGPDVKLSDFPASGGLAWSPDGNFIAASRQGTPKDDAAGIYLLSVHDQMAHGITTTRLPAFDTAPAFSPDGRQLAYVSCVRTGYGGCDVHVIALDGNTVPIGGSKRLTSQGFYFIRSLAWTRDGSCVIYEAQPGGYVNYLWRIAASGDSKPERLEIAGAGAGEPAIARARDLLAFSRTSIDLDVYRFDRDRGASAVLTSTFADFGPHYSSDGKRIAFCSERSGEGIEIWTANADGSGAHRLLHGPNKWWNGSPSWSPDGHWIAFNSQDPDGRWHVWIEGAEGGTPVRVTSGSGVEGMPTWSRDGRWLYFDSDRGGTNNIWRVLVPGDGRWERITTVGGRFGLESADGNWFLFQTGTDDSALYRMPIPAGPVTKLVGCARPSAFASLASGIYYVGCGSDPNPVLHLIDPSGADHILGTLDSYDTSGPAGGLAVSPDGLSVLYSRGMPQSVGLMLIENFK